MKESRRHDRAIQNLRQAPHDFYRHRQQICGSLCVLGVIRVDDSRLSGSVLTQELVIEAILSAIQCCNGMLASIGFPYRLQSLQLEKKM